MEEKCRYKILSVLVFCLLCLPAQFAYSQQVNKISIDKQNIEIKEVFKLIEQQTGYRFFYTDNLSALNNKVTIKYSGTNTAALLDKVLEKTTLSYHINADVKIITIAPHKADTKENNAKKKVSGKITDENGESIIGATVIVKGDDTGTITDIEGEFSLEVPTNGVISVKYVGFNSQDISVEGKTSLQITLREDTKLLDEVVVVGYGTVSRKNLTTAISTVKADNISKTVNSNMSQMLLGRAAGLQATVASSQPGGNVNISIRGAGTPIYIVDGVMMPTDGLEVGSGKTGTPNSVNRAGLAGLNPSDIESMEVMKDASAAIYGIGADNGVILITTKKGKTGKPTVTYDGSFSVVKNHSYLNTLDAQEYMNLANVFSKENYLYNKNQYPYGETPYDNGWEPTFSQVQIAAAQTTNWKDYVLKTGHVDNHNITINGGNESIRYYLGGNYYKYEGSVANAGMERFSLRTNISAQLFSFLKLTTIANINQNNYLNSSVGSDTGNQGDHGSGALQSALAYPSYLPLYANDGKYSIYKNFPNPAAMVDGINDKTNTNGYYVNFALDIDIIKDMLSAKLLYGTNKDNSDRYVYVPSDLYFGQMYKSRGYIGYSNRQHQTMEATVAFNKSIGNILRFDAVLGIGKYLEDFKGLDTSYENINDQINNDNISAADGPFYPSSYRGANEKRSQFGRLNFDILDRYVIGGTLRRDGTDKFFPDKKYSWFPSVSGAWKMSNEEFMKNISWLNLLKVRASYGQTGSDNLGTALYGLYSPSENQIKFSGNSVTYIPYLMIGADYPDVSWQKTVMKNIGVDFYILNDRISGSFDLFRNDITRMLGQAPTAPLGMLGVRPINGGHYKRTGWDATLNTTNIDMRATKFKWTSVLTLSKFDMRWIERMPNYDYNVYQKRDNEPVNANYYYKIDGIINADKSNMPESQKTLPSDAQKPGYPIIKDRNGDGRITTDDIYMDNAVPDIYLGLGNTFFYKNFDLDIFLYGQFGVKKYNYSYAWASAIELASTNPANSNEYAYTIWNSQTNPNGTRPGIAASKTVSLPGSAPTNLDVQDASFIRVRNITLGYNFDRGQLGSLGNFISTIRLFVDLQNPLLFTKYDGFDPEINTGGNSAKGKAEYPQVRTYSLGAKITF